MKPNKKETGLKFNKLSKLAQKIDKQLMDLLVSELENFKLNSNAPSSKIKIA